MTVTTANTLSVDNLTLNTLAYNVSTWTGRLTTPDVRTKNIEIPGKHGTQRVMAKRFQEGQFILNMWVRGANQDGSVPDRTIGNRLFFDNLDLLLQVFSRKSGQLDVRQSLPDGSIRQCFAEVNAVMDPTSKSANPMAQFSVALTIPDCFWQDLNAVTYTSPASLPTSEILTLSPFVGATAPMGDLVWTVTGSATNAKIQALENGSPLEQDTWMQYTGTIPSTDQLIVDCSSWSVTGSGFSPSTAFLGHAGSAQYMDLQPGPQNSAPQVQWSAASVNSHTQLTVTGRRKYVTI